MYSIRQKFQMYKKMELRNRIDKYPYFRIENQGCYNGIYMYGSDLNICVVLVAILTSRVWSRLFHISNNRQIVVVAAV